MGKYNRILLISLYGLIIGVMAMCVALVVSGLKNYVLELPNYDYTVNDVFMSDIMPVSKTQSDSLIRPYISENVKVGKSFYDKSSDSKKQEESIIYYEGTYIQNKGVDYVSEEDFDVVSSLSGEVISIEDNEIYGKVLTIKHNENLKTVYSNIANVLVSVGYNVTQGELIATSTPSKLDENNKSLLHFEVYYKNEAIDPESIYTLNVSQLQ